MSTDHAYWDGLADLDDTLPPAWRRHARDAHLSLIDEWVGRPEGRWLKTDLFEERSESRALLPRLASARWIAIDVSPGIVAAARHPGAAAGIAADVRALPFPDGSFHGVLSTSTLDHFDDVAEIDRSLAELHRVLEPGGRLILTLDNLANPLIRLRNALPPGLARRTGLVPFTVGATHDVRSGRASLERVGFAVRRVTHLLHAPHVVGTRAAAWGWYARTVLPRLPGLARTRVAPYSGHFVAFDAVADRPRTMS